MVFKSRKVKSLVILRTHNIHMYNFVFRDTMPDCKKKKKITPINQDYTLTIAELNHVLT